MEGYLGEIRYFAGTYAPKGWAFCNGQSLLIADYQALFGIIGYSYTAVSASGSFNLPNLTGKTAIGSGQGEGLSNYALGSHTGTETVTLTASQMPSHTHNTEAKIDIEISLNTASSTNTDDPQWAYLGNIPVNTGSVVPYAKSANGKMKSFQLDVNAGAQFYLKGDGIEHYNLQPYSVVCYIICIEGYYPQGV